MQYESFKTVCTVLTCLVLTTCSDFITIKLIRNRGEKHKDGKNNVQQLFMERYLQASFALASLEHVYNKFRPAIQSLRGLFPIARNVNFYQDCFLLQIKTILDIFNCFQ